VGTQLDLAIDEARVILRARRHDLPGRPDSFAAETNQSFLSIWSNLSGTFFIVMIAIASIALIVGGIVIMNIMLVSVTERTREIGVRKAIGARRLDILMQFLVESAVMAAAGGVIGVVAGMGITALVRNLTFMPASTPIAAILVSLLMATSVGLFFGIYPAVRAARLDPVEALRYEV
jgi:putative ABC transport system permease protein